MAEPGTRPKSIWSNGDFRQLWTSRAVSSLGSAVTQTALPLTAVLVLNATPGQMALLVFAGQLPDLLFGLLAGAWIDRGRRRPIMIGADIGRFLLLGSIPVTAAFGVLGFFQLWLVAFLSGVLTLCFTVASVALLPTVVESRRLPEANSRLSMAESVVSLAGPSAGGLLIQLVTAPIAIAADAVSFLVSAFFLRGVATNEENPSKQDWRLIWAEVLEGIKELLRTPLLRALAFSTGVGALAVAVQTTVFVLFLARTLTLEPVMIGIIAACWGGGTLVGAALAARAARLLGLGKAIVLGSLVFNLGGFLAPLAGLSATFQIVLLIAGQAMSAAGFTVYQINQLSLRQVITPGRLLGRVTSARRFIVFCMAPLGAAMGGAFGGRIGFTATLVVGACISLIGTAWLAFAPLGVFRPAPAQWSNMDGDGKEQVDAKTPETTKVD